MTTNRHKRAPRSAIFATRLAVSLHSKC